MNMWAGYPDFLDFLAEDFKNFLENVEEVDLKSKYLLPNIVDRLLKEERVNVRVLETQDHWFGVTYEYSYAAEPPVQFRLSHLSRRSEPL